MTFSPSEFGVVIAISWTALLVIYRLYFSPLAKFPGRKVAIATMWYDFYHQVVRQGQYPWVIRKMHEEYGPIIRINPYELHVNDPAFYNEIYTYKPLNKYYRQTRAFGNPLSSHKTVEHDLHKSRVSSFSRYFSRGSILILERPVIHKTLHKLCGRMDEFRSSRQPMPLGLAYRAFTADVISSYSMAKSFGFLDMPDFNEAWFREFYQHAGMIHILYHFPWYLNLVRRLPMSLRSKLAPAASQRVKFLNAVRQEVARAITAEFPVDAKAESIPTVFYDMAHDEKVPSEEKSLERLTDEGASFIVAGNETTGHTLSLITFHVLNNSGIHAKLKQELSTAITDIQKITQWCDLEPLPYLSAVIKEGLRMSYGVVSRMPRVSPNAPIRYKDWVIPANTPVSMNNMDMHDDPSVFVDPKRFNPDRWLQPKNSIAAEQLHKQLVPFSRGTRACVGMSLAYAEMYVTLATLFRRYEMELYETGRADVDVAHDFYTPQVAMGSKGVRVLVK